MINTQEIADYQKMCSIICTSQATEDRLQAESVLYEFISNFSNFPKIEFILSNSNDEYTIFVTMEYYNKILNQSKPDFINPNTNQIKTKSDENLKNFYMTLQNFCLNLAIAKESIMKPLVINSIANIIGLLVRRLWLDLETPDLMIDKIFEYCHQTKSINKDYIWLKIFEHIIMNITAYDSTMNYLTYRKIMLGFQNTGLYSIYGATIEFLEKNFPIISNVHNINGYQDQQTKSVINAFNIALRIIFLCLHYSFNISYFEFDTDYDTSDYCVVCFPEKWSKFMSNFNFFETLLNIYYIFSSQDEEVSLNILRSFNRIISCRLTLFDDKHQTKEFCRNMFNIIYMLTKQFSQKPNQAFLAEIIQMNIRLLNNMGLRKIRKQNQIFEDWLETLKNITLNISKIGMNINNPNSGKILEIWKRISRQSTNDHKLAEYTNKISYLTKVVSFDALKAILAGADTFFIDFNYNSTMIYLNILNKNMFHLYILAYKRFKKLIKIYFEFLYDTFMLNALENLQYLDTTFTDLLSAYTTLMTDNMQYDYNKIISINNRITIAFCVIIHGILTPNQNERSNYSDNSSISNVEIADHQGNILSNCFKFIELTINLAQNKNVQFVYNRNLELVVLFFIEQYLALTLDAMDTALINDIIKCMSRIHTITAKFLGSDDYSKVVDLIISKIISNLRYEEPTILIFSIFLLRTLLLKLKRYLSRDQFKNLSMINIISKGLQDFNSTALNTKKFYKLRSQIYEIIAIMWLDDYFDNYLEGIENICQSISAKNFPNNIMDAESIIKFFRDSAGLANYIDISKIFKYYFKIAYPLYAEIFQKFIPNYLNNPEVLLTFLDFLIALLQNKFKMIVKLWKILNAFFKGKFINFSVFQLFGSTQFLDYFKLNLEIIFTAYDYIEIFPKYLDLYIENFVIISESMLEIIFTYFDSSYVIEIMKLCIQTVKKFFEGKYVLQEIKTFQDDIILSKTSSIIYNICCFTYEEFNLKYSNEMKINIQAFFKNNTQLFKNFISYIFESSFNINKSTRIQLALSMIMFSLVIINEAIFEEVKAEYIAKLFPTIQEKEHVERCLNNIFKGVEKKYDSSNLEKFSKNYKQAIKDISRGFETMNFEIIQEIEF